MLNYISIEAFVGIDISERFVNVGFHVHLGY